MEFRSYFQFSFRIIFGGFARLLSPEKKKNITSQKQTTSQQAPKKVMNKNSKPPDLAGGFKHFLFLSLPGEMIQFD